MENNIEELKQTLEELYRTQQARLDVGADDLDIREEIAEVEEEIKELQDETIEEDSIKNERISIEEAIKTMEHWIEYEKNNKEKINRADELINIQETILSDYKRVLKEKNRLEEQVEYDKTHIYTPQTIELNFISKSKIEDKIEKLNSESYAEKLEDMMNTKNYTITELVQYVLQELLDGNDTNVGSIGNSIEEDIKILNNVKEYMQENIDKGFSKFIYNELGYDEKCIDIINAIDEILSDYKRVLKENEELHKGINSLMQSRKKWKHRYYKTKNENKVRGEE